jgi:hypothetical protein
MGGGEAGFPDLFEDGIRLGDDHDGHCAGHNSCRLGIVDLADLFDRDRAIGGYRDESLTDAGGATVSRKRGDATDAKQDFAVEFHWRRRNLRRFGSGRRRLLSAQPCAKHEERDDHCERFGVSHRHRKCSRTATCGRDHEIS